MTAVEAVRKLVALGERTPVGCCQHRDRPMPMVCPDHVEIGVMCSDCLVDHLDEVHGRGWCTRCDQRQATGVRFTIELLDCHGSDGGTASMPVWRRGADDPTVIHFRAIGIGLVLGELCRSCSIVTASEVAHISWGAS